MINPKLANLRKQLGKTQKKFSGPRAPKGGSLASRGFRGTQGSAYVVELLTKMNSTHSVNNEYASKLIRVFEATQKGELQPSYGSPASEHQILVNAARALFKAERENKTVELNKNQVEVLSKYHKMLFRRQ